MTAVLKELRELGARVSRREDRIVVDAPAGVVPSALRAKLLSYKPELIRALRAEEGRLVFGYAQDERAAILTFEAGADSASADRDVQESALSDVVTVLGNPTVLAAQHLLGAPVVKVKLADGGVWHARAGRPDKSAPYRSGTEEVRAFSVDVPRASASSASGPVRKPAGNSPHSDTRPPRNERRTRIEDQRRAERATDAALQRHREMLEPSRLRTTSPRRGPPNGR